MEDKNIQWHPGFVAAMHLELAEYRDSLTFEKEYNLNTKPLEVDLLIIKKDASLQISNEIGQFFRGHNILEYKSPDDHLDIDSFYKVLAYASLYKSYADTSDGIPAEDVTMSIVREAKPNGLFQYFRNHGYPVESPSKGIYHIKGPFPFPAQIIVTRELKGDEHVWLRALSGKLSGDTIRGLLNRAEEMTGNTDRELADSVLKVSVMANRQTIQALMGDESMYEALMEIMEPKIMEVRRMERKEGRMEGRMEGILGTIHILRKLQLGNSEIKTAISEQYGLSEEEANSYLLS